MSFELTKTPGLLSSAVKQDYSRTIISDIEMEIMAHEAKIYQALGTKPDKYVLVQDEHTSRADKTPHFTLDACGKDGQPIGTLHVYLQDGVEESVRTSTKPRPKALEAWNARQAAAAQPK